MPTNKLHGEPASSRPGGGRIIAGRFELKRMLARGGMGVVYLAEQVDLGRPVALKLLKSHSDPDNNSAFEERFELEARTLAKLVHPNIVTLYDYGRSEDGRYFLALEYINGLRFTDLIQKGVLPPERSIRLLLQVCRALRYSHRKNVIHRDLKPSNLLIQIDDEGHEHVKVVDFGLVKVLEDDQSLTQAGLILGSPHCMAPEQVRGDRDIDYRADIYAMGVLLFRSITGTWPFHGDSSTATMIAHINESMPAFKDVAPDLMVPPGLEEIIQRCLAKQPIDRYPDVGALMEALQVCIGLTPSEYVSASLVSTKTGTQGDAVFTEDASNQTLSTHLKGNRSSTLMLVLLFLFVAVVAGSIGFLLDNLPSSDAGPGPAVVSDPELVLTPEPAAAEADPSALEATPVEDVPAAEDAPFPEEVSPESEAAPAAESPPTTSNPPRRPRPRPRPAPEPAPDPVSAPSEEATAPTENGSEEPDTPEGYMGLPDDL